ncbi:MAG: helix-turn-helix domain-containing protein [Kurthia sp.]|nr:helix-turn-helix domain-containing protein [Candidatus Kurthia equi]
MKADKKLVGERLNLIRECLGLSIAELGVLLGNVPKSTVNSWIRGLALPNDAAVAKLSSLANRSETWVLYGVDKLTVKQLQDKNRPAMDDENSLKVDYFVSFAYEDQYAKLQISNTSVQFTEITNGTDIKALEQFLMERECCTGLKIINYQPY